MIRFPTKEEKSLYEQAAGRKAPPCILIRSKLWGSIRGFTPGPVILYRKDAPIDVIVHEMVHVQQWRDNKFCFWIDYYIKRATTDVNPYEAEAYEIQERAKALMNDG